MTVSLFSRLLGELKTDISPSGIQKELTKAPPREHTLAQLYGFGLFWDQLSRDAQSSGNALNPTATANALASHTEVSDGAEDYFI